MSEIVDTILDNILLNPPRPRDSIPQVACDTCPDNTDTNTTGTITVGANVTGAISIGSGSTRTIINNTGALGGNVTISTAGDCRPT